jgi:hypothetical protein
MADRAHSDAGQGPARDLPLAMIVLPPSPIGYRPELPELPLETATRPGKLAFPRPRRLPGGHRRDPVVPEPVEEPGPEPVQVPGD